MADTYYTSVRESAVATNKRHLSIFNAAGSGKTLVVYRIVGVPPVGTTERPILAALRLTGAPTGGTALTFAKAKAVNPNVPAQVTALREHTAGAIEAIAFGVSDGALVYEAPLDGSQAVEFEEGTGFEVRQGALVGTGTVSIVAVIGLV